MKVGSCSTAMTVLPGVAQLGQRARQRGHLRRMQAARRLVEQHGHPDEPAAEHRRQLDPLRLAGRQRPGRPVEVEVAEPDRAEEAQAVQGDGAGVGRELVVRLVHRREHGFEIGERRREQVVAVAALEAHRQVGRAQPLAVAGVARERLGARAAEVDWAAQ